MRRKLILLTLTILSMSLSVSGAVKKTNLRVLYVGGFSNYETMGGAAVDQATLEQGHKDRVASWTNYLNERFTTVKVIDGQAYHYTMSNDYDVTIFDGYPKPIQPKQYVKDSNGRIQKIVYEQYFPDDFDRPVICIADASEQVGRRIGTKNDWYCLCLTGWALGTKTDHAIFKGPYRVNLKMETKPMPASAKEYASIYGQKLGATIPMWQVQTKDYENTRGYKVGMVSRPWGYLDSPETEIISGGKSDKSIDAIAISRQANFLHWGFAGAPMDMTEAARAAFANAVCYIRKYAGQHILARKLFEGIGTEGSIRESEHLVTHAAYEESLQLSANFNKQMQHYSDSIKAIAANGGKISAADSMYLDFTPQPAQTYDEYMKRRGGRLYSRFGTDEKAYLRYFKDNRPYFHCITDSYELTLDEDAKSLGIAVQDKRLIERAITLWENGEDVDKARRILYRYTLLRYDNAKAFRTWLQKYGKKLFFTQSGGWLWLVDSQEKNVPGNDYSVLRYNEVPAAEAPKPTIDEKNLTPGHPVAVSAIVNDMGNGTKDVVVRMKMLTGFHVYGFVSEQDPYIVTSVEVTPPAGYTLDGALKKPANFKRIGGNGTLIYEGDVLFHQHLKGSGTGRITVKVRFQACDDHACLMPQEVEIPLNL